MNEMKPRQANGLVRELTIEELEAVSAGGLWGAAKAVGHAVVVAAKAVGRVFSPNLL
ncbi:MAG TPA: hypothetical protein VEJ16_08185 [Alphaproteobacteria bacterium]|nr:hypothetical protein [Alphaproteobacteria bacterium]